MEELERTIQKHINNFCKILPSHVDKWRSLLDESQKPAQALSNYAEQLRHVERAKINYLDDFADLQEKLRFKLFIEIEEEIATIKIILDQLNQSVHDLKNKLSLLERSTIDLNWDTDSDLIRGSAVQPPLSRLLQDGLEFWIHFSESTRRINDTFRNINVRDERSMRAFEQSLTVNLDEPRVRCFLAIVQYVDNERAVI